MPDVEIEISVDKEDIDLDLGPEDEGLVFRVHTGARPCMRCRLNAQSAKPQAPPLHPRCFPAGTVVSGPPAIQSFTRWYSGELVEIETRSGAVLAATPNHPVLTPQGWVAAGLLNERSQVVRESRPDGVVVSGPDEYQQPALIEDVAGSLGEPGTVSTTCVPVAPEDFHGDGVGSEVAVVRTDRLLRHDLDTALVKQPSEQDLVRAAKPCTALSPRGPLDQELEGILLPSAEGVSGPGVPPVLLRGSLAHGDPVGLSASSIVRELPDPLGEGGAADAVMLRKSLNGLAGSVALDQVIKVRRYPFVGHVFNLETRVGWYLASSIVVHNCQCAGAWEKTGGSIIDALR